MSAYTASERSAAIRCVECPVCLAAINELCRFEKVDMAVQTHKARVDKYYVERAAQLARRGGGMSAIRRKNRTLKIAKDGIREESLIVNSDVTDVLGSGTGRVWAEAIVRLIDAEGYEWTGNAHMEVPLKRGRKTP